MSPSPKQKRRVLGRVKRAEFIGRTASLEQIVAEAEARERRGLLILMAPLAGVSELFRQSYDELFNRQGDAVPIYYSLPANERTTVSAAIEFLNAFLTQYLAFRLNEPSVAQSSLTLNQLLELAPAADFDWVKELIEAYNQHRFSNDDRELVRFCLNAPRQIPAENPQAFLLFEAVHLSTYEDSEVPLGTELLTSLTNGSFALAGLRREILAEIERARVDPFPLGKIRLEPLPDKDARDLVDSIAGRAGVALTSESRDLLAQQSEGSPFIINALLQAAREKHLSLNSYFDCERLYVDELLGGRLNHYYTALLEGIAPDPGMREALVRVLSESLPAGRTSASLGAWAERLGVAEEDAAEIVRRLHAQEIVNWDGAMIGTHGNSTAWRDFIRSRFRLDVLREPRALVVADLMSAALKRAPQTVARHYRRAASLPLRDLLRSFNLQRVPRILFDCGDFASNYKGAPPEEVAARLEIDPAAISLPQVFHAAYGAAFSAQLKPFEEENCVVAHAFEGAGYADQNEIVWLAAKVDSKLEANAELANAWRERLENLAKRSGFVRTQLWLIADEGFSEEAITMLRDRGIYSSSRAQFELLTAKLNLNNEQSQALPDNEFVFILPMGADNELLAAATAEQIARRLNFRPEAINQIKTAIVEACINAAEHSLSPDQKIYQRFRVEDDKLVITISSRGILPPTVPGEGPGSGEQRRGWGLKLIRSLMDEVEFERVDEGTSLRMTKYLR